jgi:uncharacterized protein
VTIETVTSLEGRNIDDAMKELGRREGIKGLFVLIAAKEHKNDAGASAAYDSFFRKAHYRDAYSGFLPGFKKGDFDLGLAEGVAQIEKTLLEVKTEAGGTITPKVVHTAAPARRGLPGPTAPPVQHRPVNPQQGGAGIMTLVWSVGGIILVMIVFRMIGAMMGGGNRGGYGAPGQMGGPGYGGGYGGGGGGGGGFMSSLFGGIGGAMAGNWLYDQFSGRHRGGNEGYAPPAGGEAPPTETGGGDWGGTAGDDGGDWGGGGGDAGGGGGDWGGGGGDAGGGGGDWGGGGGGDGGGGW